MQQAAAAAPSFAGLMASLAAAAPEPEWNTDGLAEDVAVLSLEGAQRIRESRTQAQGIVEADMEGEANPEPAPPRKPPQAEHRPEWKRPQDAGRERPLTIVESDAPPARNAISKLKRASITIRMTAAESAQLHALAAESGLTVSAYLRSCAFEVEALRAQVKDALTQMRKAPMAESREAAATRPSLFRRVAHLWPRPEVDRQASA